MEILHKHVSRAARIAVASTRGGRFRPNWKCLILKCLAKNPEERPQSAAEWPMSWADAPPWAVGIATRRDRVVAAILSRRRPGSDQARDARQASRPRRRSISDVKLDMSETSKRSSDSSFGDRASHRAECSEGVFVWRGRRSAAAPVAPVAGACWSSIKTGPRRAMRDGKFDHLRPRVLRQPGTCDAAADETPGNASTQVLAQMILRHAASPADPLLSGRPKPLY